MITNKLGILFLLLVLGHTAIAADLKTYKQTYNRELEGIIFKSGEDRVELGNKYLKSLNALKERVRNAGDLESVQAAIAELTRFSTDKTVSEANTANSFPDLKKLQLLYIHNLGKIGMDKAKHIIQLVEKYDVALNKLQVSLTRSSNLADATAVRDERDAVTRSADVVQAKRILSGEAPAAGEDEKKTMDVAAKTSEAEVGKAGSSVAGEWTTPAALHSAARLNKAANLIDDNTGTANAFSPGGPDHQASFLLSSDKAEHTVTHVRLMGSPSYTSTWHLHASKDGETFAQAGSWKVGGAAQWYEYQLPTAIKASYLRINDRHPGPEKADAAFEFDYKSGI